VDVNSRVLAVLLIGEILVAVVFAVIQVGQPAGGEVSWTTLTPANLIGPGLGAALVTAITGFVGFEGTAVFSEETRDPRRTVPRATYLALAVIGLLYAFCAWAMSVATGPDAIVQRSTAEGSELIFNLVGPYAPHVLIELGRLLFTTSLFAALLAFHNTVARYLFALGREGVLPRHLGRTSPSTKAPIAGSATTTVIGFAGIALYAFGGWDPFTRMFFWLTVLGGLGVLILMTATSVAVAAYFSSPAHRRHLGAARGIAAPLVAAGALATVLVLTLDQFSVLLGVEATDPVRWMLPALFGIAGLIGVLWALILRSRRPSVYAEIGRGANREILVATPAAAR
jgi:amino acid transporter